MATADLPDDRLPLYDRPMPIPRHRRLSPSEARRAIWFDFEGRAEAAPVLLGWSLGGQAVVRQTIVEPSFARLARHDRLAALALEVAVGRLVDQAEAEERLLVAWSEHELRVVGRFCSPELAIRLEARLVNGRILAGRWIHFAEQAVPAGHRLVDYLELIGYPLPAAAGPGLVGPTLGLLAASLGRGDRSWRPTARQEERWAELRLHNRHDCLGMATVCRLAAAELVCLGR